MDLIDSLLADIHRSLDRLAEDLTPDRPDLAIALRKEASLIPRPEHPPRATSPPPSLRELRPLLYRALDEGLMQPHRFDALMVRRAHAAKILRGRKCR